MPKKRHYTKYSKPQSAARQSNIQHEEPQSRGVNDILANMRRAALAAHVNAARAAYAADGGLGFLGPAGLDSSRWPPLSPMAAVSPSPSVPPEIAQILLPGLLPAPIGGGLPHQAGAAAPGGGRRRGPAGPAPPPSWLAQSRHAPGRASWTAQRNSELRSLSSSSLAQLGLDMPGIARPAKGSLVDRALRRMALEWHVQKHYNQYHLMHLRGPLRAAIISYLGQLSEDGKGVSISDLRALLLPPVVPAEHGDGGGGDGGGSGGEGSDQGSGEESHTEHAVPSPSTLNEDLRYLDLSGAVGRTLSLKELSDLLFPGGAAGARGQKAKGRDRDRSSDDGLLESWDLPGVPAPPRALLPNLTHLCLALDPEHASASPSHAPWRHLLAFASHLPMLTHLSLSCWPEPTLTPNARRTTVVSPQGRRVPYGGTSFYSHSVDNDWAEAVLLVRKLSQALYGLEYLDLTGCASWHPALMKRVDGDQVDWAGDWGKITTLVLAYGSGGGSSAGDCLSSGPPGMDRRAEAETTAKEIERHIRQQRAGRGRFITVEYARGAE